MRTSVDLDHIGRSENMIYYTKEHGWLSVDGDVAILGITQHAAEALGDLVSVEIAKPLGSTFAVNDVVAVVESVKAASEIYAPVSGELIEINTHVAHEPSLVNSFPESDGWFFKIRLANHTELDGLLDREAYDAHANTNS
jgi:glycine cleavage system H protein